MEVANATQVWSVLGVNVEDQHGGEQGVEVVRKNPGLDFTRQMVASCLQIITCLTLERPPHRFFSRIKVLFLI